jgi:ubiquitin-conjugating enzyme E2 G1
VLTLLSSPSSPSLFLFSPFSEGGYFPCLLEFPSEYPNKPPTMTFTTKGFWHPNVYKDGRVCISILHEAKADEFNQQEKMSEKWRPILGVEAVLVSVLSMLSDPNFESPANIDASVGYRGQQRREGRKRGSLLCLALILLSVSVSFYAPISVCAS